MNQFSNFLKNKKTSLGLYTILLNFPQGIRRIDWDYIIDNKICYVNPTGNVVKNFKSLIQRLKNK
jgi:hypothetical protein